MSSCVLGGRVFIIRRSSQTPSTCLYADVRVSAAGGGLVLARPPLVASRPQGRRVFGLLFDAQWARRWRGVHLHVGWRALLDRRSGPVRGGRLGVTRLRRKVRLRTFVKDFVFSMDEDHALRVEIVRLGGRDAQ